MPSFLKPELINESFKRLGTCDTHGKKHLERSSGIFYFLAIAATCKNNGCEPLDLNPDSLTGKTNRESVELEFSKLVKIKSRDPNISRSVVELGKIETGGTPPEKRISSNFFTVPLKKASIVNVEFSYPKRPAPLLKMGIFATGRNWGVCLDDDWQCNLPRFLAETRTTTPFIDLAIFVLKSHRFPNAINNELEAIEVALHSLYGASITIYWMAKIHSELRFRRGFSFQFVDTYNDPLSDGEPVIEEKLSDPLNLSAMSHVQLIERVQFLERLIFINNRLEENQNDN